MRENQHHAATSTEINLLYEEISELADAKTRRLVFISELERSWVVTGQKEVTSRCFKRKKTLKEH